MPTRNSFEYAVIRVVPRPELEEFINAGVILFCLERGYLDARVHADAGRIRTLWPQADVNEIAQHLEAIPRICAGGPGAGPIGELSRRERFHWLVSPRSTVIQVSPVHAGLCDSPEKSLAHLFEQFVDRS